jgi:uracil-DNA glycosylase family 4
MGDKEKHTIQSVSRDFVKTIQDFSQYISHQKALGNNDLTISRSALERMNTWGLPPKKIPSQKKILPQNKVPFPPKVLPQKKVPPFFFQGRENSRVFFVDSEGSFFNGKSGALLVKILKAMEMTPGSVSICNAPDLDSIHACIQKNQPKIIIALGQRAGQLLLNTQSPLESFQGRFHTYNGIQVMPTFHPSILLDQPGLKRKVWDDMQQVMKLAGSSNYPHALAGRTKDENNE